MFSRKSPFLPLLLKKLKNSEKEQKGRKRVTEPKSGTMRASRYPILPLFSRKTVFDKRVAGTHGFQLFRFWRKKWKNMAIWQIFRKQFFKNIKKYF